MGLLGAGGPAGANVARSMLDAGHRLVGIEGNPLRQPLVEGEPVFQEYDVYHPDFIDWVNTISQHHGIAYLHSQPEEGVEVLSRFKDQLVAKTLLPSIGTVLKCQDKFATGIEWRRAGLRETRILRIESEDELFAAGEELGYPFWMRATHGAGARGATEVHSYQQGSAWFDYWLSRGSDWDFVAEEFLPGRDYAWTSLWYKGKLVTSQARERLEYIFPHLAPSGRTGTPTVAVTIHSEAVNVMATEAVLAVDPSPHGLFCVDLREDRDCTPRPTEINAGRFFTTSYFYTAAGLNIPSLCATLATTNAEPEDLTFKFGGQELAQYNPLPEGLYWIRHIDCPAVLAVKEEGRLVPVMDARDADLRDWARWWEESRV